MPHTIEDCTKERVREAKHQKKEEQAPFPCRWALETNVRTLPYNARAHLALSKPAQKKSKKKEEKGATRDTRTQERRT